MPDTVSEPRERSFILAEETAVGQREGWSIEQVERERLRERRQKSKAEKQRERAKAEVSLQRWGVRSAGQGLTDAATGGQQGQMPQGICGAGPSGVGVIKYKDGQRALFKP